MNIKVGPRLISVTLTLLLLVTNPGLDQHKATAKAKILELSQPILQKMANNANAAESVGLMIGQKIVEQTVENGITRDNYLLFSITKFTFNTQTKRVGIGVLGHVFIFARAEDLKI